MEKMERNTEFSQFYDEMLSFLKKSKDDFIVYPKGVETILEEQNSVWNFQLDLNNTCNTARQIAILAGRVPCSRIVQLDASKRYTAFGGGLVTTPYDANSFIELNDDPRLLNKISEISCDAVATQTRQGGVTELSVIKQTLYKDGTGELTLTSKDFFIDMLQRFLAVNPARIFEFQISTNNPLDVFGQRISYKNMNPLIKEQMNYINLEDFYTPDNSVSTKIIVPAKIYVGDETFMSISIPAATQLTLSMRFSAYHSQENAIRSKLKGESFFKSFTALKKESRSETTSSESITSFIKK